MLEICCQDLASVHAAAEGGADRIELCSALSCGGVTPSAGLVREAREIFKGKLHVLIRPREGNFIYSPAEVEAMCYDISKMCDLGADGFAIGAMTSEMMPDHAVHQRLMRCSPGASFTFHRVFDRCVRPMEAMESCIKLGFNRILTSGCQPSAVEGITMLEKLHKKAAGRIITLPAAGINSKNLRHLLQETGCTEAHASAKIKIPAPEGLLSREDSYYSSDIEEIKKLSAIIHN